ncbi:hypothetical protein [Enterococcus sp. DIV0876]|uniref:hypothetical protein n=1 Tax=Enterococcus sp. DIV0876 TaxID=2774633 RepID=UPI003D2FC9F1
MAKSEIFRKAWKLAKRGAFLFGGSSKEYFAEALKLVYRSEKAIYTLEISGGSRKHKSWVAKVNGTDAKWGFARTFVEAADYGVYKLEDGVYNIKDAAKNDQQFLLVANGKAIEIEKEEVLANL